MRKKKGSDKTRTVPKIVSLDKTRERDVAPW